MNTEQKKRIAHEISNWKNACNCRAVQLTGDRMAALLQELIDKPEVEPVATVTGYYGGYLSIATVDGRVLPTGTALYTAPPAPSVPDMPRLKISFEFDDLEEPVEIEVFGTERSLLRLSARIEYWATLEKRQEAPSVPDGWRYVIPGRRRTEKSDSSRVGDYNQGWNDCRGITEKALNDLEKRK